MSNNNGRTPLEWALEVGGWLLLIAACIGAMAVAFTSRAEGQPDPDAEGQPEYVAFYIEGNHRVLLAREGAVAKHRGWTCVLANDDPETPAFCVPTTRRAIWEGQHDASAGR